MEEAKRTLAYICPSCRQSVIAEKTVFALAAGVSSIPCPCGKSALKSQVMDDKVQLAVPCAACDTTHSVTCKLESFIEQKTLACSCAVSGLDCCYVGDEDSIFAAMPRLEESVDKLEMAQASEGMFLDDVIMQECLEELKDIAERKGISCSCGSDEWLLKVNFSTVDLTCPHCGGALRVPTATADDLEDLCCKHTLQIQSRGV